jgi:hypothetical protein
MRIRTLLLVAGAGYAGYRLALRPWWERWGVEPAEAGAALAGDDLVLAPDRVETRGIDIAAPPEDVWPWLVQMGFGRAGWYSYDRVDMEGGSAVGIRPELQHLEVGDIVPTHPGGGFEVRALEPGRSLVLYTDDALMGSQAKAAKAAGTATGATPSGLEASGAFMSAGMGERFSVSWAFVLEPTSTGSRLVERVRVSMPDARGGRQVLGPMVGFGVFLMIRQQLLGIRDRAEGVPASAGAEPAPVPEAVTNVAPEAAPTASPA